MRSPAIHEHWSAAGRDNIRAADYTPFPIDLTVNTSGPAPIAPGIWRTMIVKVIPGQAFTGKLYLRFGTPHSPRAQFFQGEAVIFRGEDGHTRLLPDLYYEVEGATATVGTQAILLLSPEEIDYRPAPIATVVAQEVGAQADAWNAANVLAAGVSASVDVTGCPFVSAFGNAGAANEVTAQYSQDGTTWYKGPATATDGGGDFTLDFQTAARFVRLLLRDAANPVTATIAGKG